MTDPTNPQVPEEPAVPPVEPVATPEVPAYTAPAEPVATPYTAPAEPVAPAYVAPAEPVVAPAAAADAPAAAPVYAPAAAGPKQALSLTSFIVGLAALVFAWITGLGTLAAIAAIVLGFIAKSREKDAPRWMWLVGIITGFVALLLSLILVAVTVILPLIFLASVRDYVPNVG